MQLLYILIPCILVGTGVGLVLDRTGVLPHVDEGGFVSSRPVTRSTFRPLSIGMIVILATWILAWLVVLGVGIDVIMGSV